MRDAPPPQDTTDGLGPREPLQNLAAQYGKYLTLFIGAGLISGSVVHFPLAPARYAAIGTAGALLFAAASVLTDGRSKDLRGVARAAGTALTLALGIGMMGGSIQHFADIPDRAAVLFPLGLVLSSAAFAARREPRPTNHVLSNLAASTLVTAFVLHHGLTVLADRMDRPADGHSDAPAASTTRPGSAAPEPQARADERGTSVADASEPTSAAADGHATSKQPDRANEAEAKKRTTEPKNETERRRRPSRNPSSPKRAPRRSRSDTSDASGFSFISEEDAAEIARLEQAAVAAAIHRGG